MKKSCLLICYTELGKDPRVMKHYKALGEDFEIYTAGLSPIGSEHRFVKITNYSIWERIVGLRQRNRFYAILLVIPVRCGSFLRFRLFDKFYYLRYWTLGRRMDLRAMKKMKAPDLIIANDLNTLPLAVTLAGPKTKVVYDAHEYHAEELAERKFWVDYNRPLINYLYKRYISGTDTCITVGGNIARRYESDFHRPFQVVSNASPYQDIKPRTGEREKIKIVYSGLYGPNRNVDAVIGAMDALPAHFELHLLVTNPLESLHRLIHASGSKDRITLHKAVSLNEVVPFLSQFDIGVHLMAPLNFNNENALPNKYFQYIQARLVTLFGPLKEIMSLTEEYGTGLICRGFSAADMAEAIAGISIQQIDAIKENNVRNARLLCEENEVEKLKEIYKLTLL